MKTKTFKQFITEVVTGQQMKIAVDKAEISLGFKTPDVASKPENQIKAIKKAAKKLKIDAKDIITKIFIHKRQQILLKKIK